MSIIEQFGRRRRDNGNHAPMMPPPLPTRDHLTEAAVAAANGIEELRQENHELRQSLGIEREEARLREQGVHERAMRLQAELTVATETLAAVQAERDEYQRRLANVDAELSIGGTVLLRAIEAARAASGRPEPVVDQDKLLHAIETPAEKAEDHEYERK